MAFEVVKGMLEWWKDGILGLLWCVVRQVTVLGL